MSVGATQIEWNGAKQQEGVDILLGEGGMIVSPTKVGYIIMTSDFSGLRRKFSAKHRALTKPARRPMQFDAAATPVSSDER